MTDNKPTPGPAGFDRGEGGMRLERYDRDCTRILNAAGNVVALIERLANNRWAVFVDGIRQTRRSFAAVRHAALWWIGRERLAANALQSGAKGEE